MRSKGDNAGPPADVGNGLALKIVILRARNLAAKDRGGTSDPYLVLTLGDARAVTHSVSKTLNPEWNVIEELPVNSVHSLVLDVICWDKDRFGKDYMGEFDLALEEIFQNEKTEQEARWFPLKSKRPGKKTSIVSGEVLLQFTLLDGSSPNASPQQIFDKFYSLVGAVNLGSSRNVTPSMTPLLVPTNAPKSNSSSPDDGGDDDDDDDFTELDDDANEEGEDPSKPETAEKRRRRLRIKGLKKRRRQNPYALSGSSDVVGIIFLEICKITDLPPESNLTRTGFDMDPFVVASLGKKTYRTRRVRHNLNPVFNEKMIFHVQGHEQSYSFAFTVIDHDKYSGNDFIASCTFPVHGLIERAPQADPETGLYCLPDFPEHTPAAAKARFKKLNISRNSSSQSLGKMMRPGQSKTSTGSSTGSQSQASDSGQAQASGPSHLAPTEALANPSADVLEPSMEGEDTGFHDYVLPLKMKNLDKWESKHNPVIYLRAKYMPYSALRQQFWRAMLRQYDTDESGEISRIELTTMLDTLGSTLRESTIDSFFHRFPHKAADNEESWDLTMDEAVICLEDQLQVKSKPAASAAEKLKSLVPDMKHLGLGKPAAGSDMSGTSTPQISIESHQSNATAETNTPAEPEGDEDLGDDREEHVVEIRECPICHQPRLNKRSDSDIITHIATCASQDWRQVNTVLMGGFVTASQAQRKWYSKVITKISYGGYKLGANSANILVQDRMTGQINEEKMSVYVRLGIRLLYKGLKSRDMENKRIRKLLKNLSIKQGKKFDDPASRDEIEKFIEFHGLDMSEVLLPVEEFRNFNEFFYRALKPDARPCSAPNNPKIIVSPADCRSVVFNQMTQATKIWVKGREFNMRRLLGNAYPDDAARYENGALGIFRLAPQDYHRFHIPVDGVMGKPVMIAGEYYTVNPMAIRSALDVYGENVRVVVPIDSEAHGRVMVICVGAMMVGSTVITRNEGDYVKRAEELGYFKFGGSTILVLFEPGKMRFDDDLADNSSGALETLVRAGMSIGHSPDQAQWTPDMRKNDEDVTEAEKKEAKRRIQGNVGMQESSGDSGEDGEDQAPSSARKLSTAPTVNTLAASAM
ncbi:phosphatidylserine decarboxylase [Hirsutella rhossiliensis]|uniref:Phosphatidylserine decarboxylase proenzyme 2 n=1 Tax=Hirsutella rhossiliensis TaxID=111463 RepID=A0A9P8SN51_9HYPO|nr:phosphatidylserine decarboxylase domain-containing protein [Hirsutella rhossiliensis]KAH0967520.1 phosphatidylserine decarboxylase domain-containing protein [Hirsutella rhossiliensis]